MDHWLARARAEGAPLIDRDTVTFVWNGETPPVLVSDLNAWNLEEPVILEEVSPQVWIYQLQLPDDAYLEYAYLLDNRRLRDPFNDRTVPNGLGETNHYFYMPSGEHTPLVYRRADIPHGSLIRRGVETGARLVGKQRTVVFYQPPVEEPVPLVVVWDGAEYLRLAHLPQIVDNLIAEDVLLPIALALVSNHKTARFQEYMCSEATLNFLTDYLLPAAHRELNLIDPETETGAYAVMGSSQGGLMALYTGLRMPEIFGNVLSQSGAFSIANRDFLVYDLVRYLPVNSDLNIWMDCGRYEEMLETNQRMAVLLKEMGYRVEYNEYNGGHNYTAWQDDLWQGLVHLYPKPELYLGG